MEMEGPITRIDVSKLILAAKLRLGLRWVDVAAHVKLSKEFVTAGCLGQMTFDPETATKIGELFGLPPRAIAQLQVPPYRGSSSGAPSEQTSTFHDPLIYRFHEMISVYGTTLKELINEEFGDGIMSAIDFKMDVQREVGESGEDRVKIVMSGKYLPYKKY
jgi:cyanate lyase